MRERKEIDSKDLTEHDIPKKDAEWNDIMPFALSFNGYHHAGSTGKCISIANKHSENYTNNGVLPSTLTELRTCLFAEQRRCRWLECIPTGEDLDYIKKLIEAIRQKVALKEFD